MVLELAEKVESADDAASWPCTDAVRLSAPNMPERPPLVAPAPRLLVALIGCELASVGADEGPGDLGCELMDDAERGRREALVELGEIGPMPYE